MSYSFIEHPFQPEKKIYACIVSCEAEDVIRELENLGILVLKTKRNSKLPEPVCSHADLQVLPLGGNRVAVDTEQVELIEEMLRLGFDVISINGAGSDYPDDCILDHVIVNRYLFGKIQVVPKSIISLNLYEMVNVNQGYAKCSTIVLDEETLLTDDKSIGREATKHINNVFVLKQDEVLLKGYDHGFIGGSCGKLDKDLLCFAGHIPQTAFGDSLKKILKDTEMRYLETGNGQIRDIGGIIPILI